MIKSKKQMYIVVGIFALILFLGGITYAFFNYTRVGSANSISTSTIIFNTSNDLLIDVSNDFPQDDLEGQALADMKANHMGTLSVSGHNTLANGVIYHVYVVRGDDITSKQRLKDENILFQFTPNFTSGQNGFTIMSNSYSSPTSLTFDNTGKALISTGLVKNTSSLTTVSYNYYMWIDSANILVSSTSKRATLAEGNPSLADTTSGTTTAGRYMTNSSTLTTITLYPAKSEHSGKTVYTTNEFSNGFYNIKILVEAENYTPTPSPTVSP